MSRSGGRPLQVRWPPLRLSPSSQQIPCAKNHCQALRNRTLVIDNVVMGGITGIEAANEILTFLPTCRVILFSGQATTLDLLSRSTTQNFEILQKPMPPEALLQRI